MILLFLSLTTFLLTAWAGLVLGRKIGHPVIGLFLGLFMHVPGLMILALIWAIRSVDQTT